MNEVDKQVIQDLSQINFKKALDRAQDLEYYIYLKDVKFFDSLKDIHVPYINTQIVIECEEDTKIPDSKYSLVLKKTDSSEKWYAKALSINRKVKYIAIYDLKENTIDLINERLAAIDVKEDVIVNYPQEFEFIKVN